MSRTLSGLRRETRISLEKPQRKRASACIEGRISWFISSCGGDIRDLLVGPHGGPVSTQVTMGLWGFLCSLCRGRGPYLELMSEPQGSSPGPTWISGFLWGVHRGVRAWSLVEPCKSTLLSIRKNSYSLPIRLTVGIGGFLSRCHRAVTAAIVFRDSPLGDCRVSAGESCVSAMNWDMRGI